MSAAEQLSTNEVTAARESLEASLAAHKAEQDADLDEMARSGQPFRTRADEAPAQTEIPAHVPPPYSQIEFSTKSGALPPKEAPEPSEAPSAKAARARLLLKSGVMINDELTEAIRVDDQFAEKRADEAIAYERSLREAFRTAAPALIEATAAAVSGAEAYVEGRAAYQAAREQYETLIRHARRVGLTDVPVIPSISSLGAQNTEEGYRVRKIVQALAGIGGW